MHTVRLLALQVANGISGRKTLSKVYKNAQKFTNLYQFDDSSVKKTRKSASFRVHLWFSSGETKPITRPLAGIPKH